MSLPPLMTGSKVPHLRRCVELAEQALVPSIRPSSRPFGSRVASAAAAGGASYTGGSIPSPADGS